MACAEFWLQVVIAALSAAATLSAAYFGAKFAFDFQNSKSAEEQDWATVKGANLAIFELMRTHHNLTAIKRQFIDPLRNDEDRHFSILPSTSHLTHLNINFADLAYLLSSTNPNLLNELALTQAEINGTVDLVNRRSDFHLTEFQPLLERHHAQLGETTSLRRMEEIIGIRSTQLLRALTDAMIINVDDGLEILTKEIAELNKVTKTMFSGHLIIRMDRPSLRPET